MIRGTATQFTFKLPKEILIDDITSIEVRVWQKGYNGTPTAKLPIVKSYTNENWNSSLQEEHTLVVVLSSEETARLTDKLKGYIQCKVVVGAATPYATLQQRFTVYPMYEDLVGGEIGDTTISSEGWIILDGQTIV